MRTENGDAGICAFAMAAGITYEESMDFFQKKVFSEQRNPPLICQRDMGDALDRNHFHRCLIFDGRWENLQGEKCLLYVRAPGLFRYWIVYVPSEDKIYDPNPNVNDQDKSKYRVMRRYYAVYGRMDQDLTTFRKEYTEKIEAELAVAADKIKSDLPGYFKTFSIKKDYHFYNDFDGYYWRTKYHPKSLSEMCLNDHTRARLDRLVRDKRSAILYSEPGMGKSSFCDMLQSFALLLDKSTPMECTKGGIEAGKAAAIKYIEETFPDYTYQIKKCGGYLLFLLHYKSGYFILDGDFSLKLFDLRLPSKLHGDRIIFEPGGYIVPQQYNRYLHKQAKSMLKKTKRTEILRQLLDSIKKRGNSFPKPVIITSDNLAEITKPQSAKDRFFLDTEERQILRLMKSFQVIKFRRAHEEDIYKHLCRILHAEEVPYKIKTVRKIAECCRGNMQKAVDFLQVHKKCLEL
jgi:hypothetical protein